MESRTIALLKEAGKKGLLVSELALQLDQPAENVLKIVDLLKSNGQVEKVEEQHNGEAVIRIIWRGNDQPEWGALQGCPCFVCTEIDQCGAGQPFSPWTCEKLNGWLNEQLSSF